MSYTVVFRMFYFLVGSLSCIFRVFEVVRSVFFESAIQIIILMRGRIRATRSAYWREQKFLVSSAAMEWGDPANRQSHVPPWTDRADAATDELLDVLENYVDFSGEKTTPDWRNFAGEEVRRTIFKNVY